MSKIRVLGEAISLTSAAPQAAVAMNTAPLAAGFNGVVMIHLAGATGTPTVKVQGAGADLVYTDMITVTAVTGLIKLTEVTLRENMRLNVTAVGTAGTASAYVIE